MWYVTPGDQTTCFGCDHLIGPEELCISDLQEDLPKSESRKSGRHFHFSCSECEGTRSDPTLTCYQKTSSLLLPDKATEESVCLFCGHLIKEGESRIQDFFYVRDVGQGAFQPKEKGPAALLSALAKGQLVEPSTLSGFSQRTFNKFRRAGLRNGQAPRGPVEASNYYRTSVPGYVRNLGEEAVRKFTEGKDASHIRSVANSPGRARDPMNIIWENSNLNARRGPQDMTRLEWVRARGLNYARSARIVGGAVAKQAGRGAAYAALVELPISLVENGIHIYRGKKKREDAIKDTGRDLATAGAAGAVLGAGTTAVVALGGGSMLAASGPVLIPIGVGVLALSTSRRIWKAWNDELSRVELNFHSSCSECDPSNPCYLSFADWVSTYES